MKITSFLLPPALFIASVGALFAAAPAASDTSLLRPTDRVVFIGDSITGQGATNPNGWRHLIENALRTTHQDASYQFVSLGGSGQSVGSWLNVEKRSREQAVILDVKGVDVRAELSRSADVVVCMLGMNDVLFPQIKDTPENFDRWAERYRELIRLIRERTQPRVFALATPTLCTEDLVSPKNRVMSSLIERLTALAALEKCVVLPTNETMRDILAKGRSCRADFHVTGDFVHPNAAGHVAIAAGMLKGLGETDAASALVEKHASTLFRKDPISWEITRLPVNDLTSPRETFRIRIFDNTDSTAAARPRLTLPPGWSELPRVADQPADAFVIEGVPDRLANRVHIDLGRHVANIDIPAPWLIGTARQSTAGWSAKGFDPDAKKMVEDAWFSKGERFGEPHAPEPEMPLVWSRHIASVNYGGEASPGAIDFAGVTFFHNFDVAYGARWIYSPASTPVTLQVGRLGYANGGYLAVWLNGERLHAATIGSVPNTEYAATLKSGWNALVFRSHNFQVQWQFSLDLKADNTELLRFAAWPPSK